MIPNIFDWQSGGSTAPTPPDPPVIAPVALPRSCISLARYARLTGWGECAINGVAKDGEPTGECENPIWTEYQRDTLLYYLAEAQQRIEQEVGYPLCPTYIANENHSLRVGNAFPLRARWTKVLEAGVRAETVIGENALVDYSEEPAVVGPIATSVTDESEIRVFYPNSEREIEPSQVLLSGGAVTVWIPRCRLVSSEYFDNPAEGWAYDDDSHFETGVDVRRVYTDSSVNAQFVYAHRSSANGTCPNCGCATCGEATADACLYVSNPETGALDAMRGTYAAGTWTAETRACYGARPSGIRVNYLAGLTAITPSLETAVLRLAHSLMPVEPCGCDVFKSIWSRDTHVPDFISPEREASSFGWSDGAFFAWKTVHAANQQVRRMSVI